MCGREESFGWGLLVLFWLVDGAGADTRQSGTKPISISSTHACMAFATFHWKVWRVDMLSMESILRAS